MSQAQELYESALRLFKEDQIDAAIPHLEKAIELDPTFADAYEALGLLYEKRENLDRAIALMKKLSELDRDNIMAHSNLSRFYVQKGWIEEAEKEQAEARRLSWKRELRGKKVTEEEIKRIEAQKFASEKEGLKERIANFQKAIEMDPNDVLGYFSLASAYLDGKEYEEAGKAFQQAVRVDPAHSPSYVGLGQALEALGRRTEAADVYRKGIPVAQGRGDIIPLRKMETRLRALESQGGL